MKKDVNVRFLNADENYVEYLEEAIAFDDKGSWLLDDSIDEDIIWDLEDFRFSSFTYGLFLADKLIGLMMINFTKDENEGLTFDTSIIIDPQYRRCGMGNFLFQKVINDLKERSNLINTLQTTIYADNVASQQLVLRNGFVFQEQRKVNDKVVYIYRRNLKDVSKVKKMS